MGHLGQVARPHGVAADGTAGAGTAPAAEFAPQSAVELAFLPLDPEFGRQQYLFQGDAGKSAGGVDINLLPAWALGLSGKGVSIGIFDTAMDVDHVDLHQNVDLSKAIAGAHPTSVSAYGDEHATAVAGIIAGARNDTGIVGVAYDARITPVNIFDEAARADYIWKAIDQQARFDVTNHSWAFTTVFDPVWTTRAGAARIDGFAEAAAHGRGGLGTIAAVAAGTYRAYGSPTEMNGLTVDRHVVVVGATDMDGHVTAYSNPGASLLVVAPSSGDETGVTTSDVTGEKGYSPEDYTSSFGGTSAATPQVAGVVALMLDANPRLGWRDVQTILAITARHTGSDLGEGAKGYESADWQENGAGLWNGGGLHFSNDYGFGLVAAAGAVPLAPTWNDAFGRAGTSRNERVGVGQATAWQDLGGGATATFTVEIAKNVSIEALVLSLPDLSFSDARDLVIEVVSPDGTVSRLLDDVGVEGARIGKGWTLMSRAFLGENAAGTWTVTVTSLDPADAGRVGRAVIKAYGAAGTARSGTVFYTDEFAAAWTEARGLIDSALVPVVLNAGAVTSDIDIDLAARAGTVAGKALTIAEGTTVRTVVGGAGDDRVVGGLTAVKILGGFGGDDLTGGGADDRVLGGGGDDRIAGGGGRDELFGGAGFDTLSLAGALSGVRFSLAARGWQAIDELGAAKQTDFEALAGSEFADTLIGDARDNELDGAGGDDVLVGGEGADRLIGGSGTDTASYAGAAGRIGADLSTGIAWGAAGSDTLDGIENVVGSRFADLLIGDAGANLLAGRAGADVLEGRAGADVLLGGSGIDTAAYVSSAEGVTVDLATGAGSRGDAEGDALFGIENLRGSAFDDALLGDDGANAIAGGDGDDLIEGRGGDDVLDGGAGIDTVSYAGARSGVTVDLGRAGPQVTGGAGRDVISGFENVVGSAFADRLTGDAGDNVITGGGGRDVLTGGAGADTFAFLAASDGGDVIQDFAAGVDRIRIDRDGFGIGNGVTVGGSGDGAFEAWFVSGAGAVATADGHGQFVYDTATHVLWWDADGAGAGAAVAVATLANGALLQATDFDLV